MATGRMGPKGQSGAQLPGEVERLSWREKEVAIIVYTTRAVTASEVCRNVSGELKNATVRSTLNRLVKKGILKRVMSDRAFVYLPAVTLLDSKTSALKRFAEDHFAGSVERAAATMKALLEPQRR